MVRTIIRNCRGMSKRIANHQKPNFLGVQIAELAKSVLFLRAPNGIGPTCIGSLYQCLLVMFGRFPAEFLIQANRSNPSTVDTFEKWNSVSEVAPVGWTA